MRIRKCFALFPGTIHVRVGDGGVSGRRGQVGCRCRHLCGVEGGRVTEVSDVDLHCHPEEANLQVRR